MADTTTSSRLATAGAQCPMKGQTPRNTSEHVDPVSRRPSSAFPCLRQKGMLQRLNRNRNRISHTLELHVQFL